ncbi:histone deacetylase family protein [Arsukibacterium indicum]|uniref:Histone deacetylase n=1 Tax=Arsukibacterium indicum TaxID=2848612 RepID=A0ABS6MH62_9GAMM|nr:histone deacetylase [Arsukibacterium indicum]MBV2128129.1 histone deacetylase [Arsukibacterium indicum]
MPAVLPGLVYHPCYSALSLPERHRYPIAKYQALYQALLASGITPDAFSTPQPIAATELNCIHNSDYIDSICNGTIPPQAMRRIGFPWSQTLVERSLVSVAGTRLCAELALQRGIGLHLSGGYHHARHAEGAGFCVFNDLAFAARSMLARGLAKILIFDLDVHQGDGTAGIFSDDPAVITASVHCEKNFPARKIGSDWDIGLAKQCADAEYLEAVHQSLESLLNWHQPELVLYDAGVDIHQQDELGLLQISTSALYQRDLLVLNACRSRDIPVAAVIGGGYQRDVAALTQLHLQLFKAAFTVSGLPFGAEIKT